MGGGRVKGQLSLGAVVTSMVRQRMGKAPAVQSARALPMGRCASPWTLPFAVEVRSGDGPERPSYGIDRGVPMSRVDFKKWPCPPSLMKNPCR